jgi:methionyl aminopeptidase
MVVVRDDEAEVLSTFQYIEDVIEPPYELDVLKETPTR